MFTGLQVDGDGMFQRVSGTNVGGGTYWGLGKLLTKCKRLSLSDGRHCSIPIHPAY